MCEMVISTSIGEWPIRLVTQSCALTLQSYMQEENFDFVGRSCGLKLKEPHSITEKWPLRLKAGSSDSTAQKEFDMLQASMHSGSERYVEWRKCATE